MKENNLGRGAPNQSRRSLVLLLPWAAISGLLATWTIAAFRFLRPVSAASSEEWFDLAPVAELTKSKPVARKVAVEQVNGWARSPTQQTVFIMPGQTSRVLSAVCPHEGCEVAWRDDLNIFSCPCHESDFAADGRRLSGPAPHDLKALPARIVDGRLQVRS
jgi:Rieske Fe-S protein